MQRALDFERSPPLWVSFRFFLNVPVFLMLSALGLAWSAFSGHPFTRWNPLILATTHFFTLGVLASAMLGAMMQILPVATRIHLLLPRITSFVVHTGLSLGTLALAAGFISSRPRLHILAMILLSTAFLVFLIAVTVGMMKNWAKRAPGASEVLAAIRLALLALAVTLVLGVFMAGLRGNVWAVGATDAGAWLHDLPNLHVAWGLAGWVGLLVAGVSYQVIPIFQATEIYPRALTDVLAPAVFLLLGVASVAGAWDVPPAGGPGLVQVTCIMLLGLAFLSYALVTAHLLLTRKRPAPEPTTLFWHVAMASLASAALVGILCAWFPHESPHVIEMLLGVLLVPGFAVSAVNGMLYKIVPFLLWHNAQRKAPVALPFMPKVKHFISEQSAKRQFLAHLAAVGLLAASSVMPGLLAAASLALAVSATMLGWNMLQALFLYERTCKKIRHAMAEGQDPAGAGGR